MLTTQPLIPKMSSRSLIAASVGGPSVINVYSRVLSNTHARRGAADRGEPLMRTVPRVPNQLMWFRWGLIHGIGFTELGTPFYGIHTLLKRYETAIRATGFITAHSAPWIVLRVGKSFVA